LTKVIGMSDLMNLAMLICASIAALVFGVFAAYGILRIAFVLMRPRQRTAAVKPSPEMAQVS
jgi:uncharacterized protein (DUF2062 family)